MKDISQIKNNLFHVLLILFLGINFSCSVTKSKRTEVISEKVDPLYIEIDRLGKELTVKNNVPGIAVAVIKNGKVAWIQTVGYADLASKKPVTSKTIFNIGSISKLVSAWGFMQLSEKGLVKLDEPVDKYLTRWHFSESEFNQSKVTLKRLLSHTAGLSVHGYGGSDQGIRLLSLEESLNGKTKRNGETVHLINEPGTKWQYSGGGYTVAQLLLEETTKKGFSEYMKENVFLPLRMKNTSYEWTEDMMGNSATAYDELGKPIKNRIFTEKAAAGLQTTIEDLAHFAELSITPDKNQLNNVLTKETILLMETPVLPFSNEGKSGLGYRFLNFDGFETIGHTGENAGWSTALLLDLPTKSGIIVLCNGSLGDRVWFPIYQNWVKTIKSKN
ncbi:serine hydrolase domain-containing protein [Chryseobacterium sp. 3008163]|uniref:serine hydrolase domain-containing protein n=1 Tax=Chryseobacterium sp. 3008163 TaxID=2478663 RepID=UPI000F0C4CC0|nr:serine hydrolase domain-containing protein [Chryseobacterium sp. 3008163]AYN01454.1 class A beta-lactamase-related serine hydrolase [Chryseobacterium sp. 3008163]